MLARGTFSTSRCVIPTTSYLEWWVYAVNNGTYRHSVSAPTMFCLDPSQYDVLYRLRHDLNLILILDYWVVPHRASTTPPRARVPLPVLRHRYSDSTESDLLSFLRQIWVQSTHCGGIGRNVILRKANLVGGAKPESDLSYGGIGPTDLSKSLQPTTRSY